MGLSPAPMAAHRATGGDHPGSWRGGAAPVGGPVRGLGDDANQVCSLSSLLSADCDISRSPSAGLTFLLLSADLLHACKQGQLKCVLDAACRLHVHLWSAVLCCPSANAPGESPAPNMSSAHGTGWVQGSRP